MSIRTASIDDLSTINNFLKDMGIALLDNVSFYQSYRHIYVIEKKKIVIAFICFSILYDQIELESIYVALDFRNQGYSSLLMQKMINEGIVCNCSSIFLEVREKNAIAQSLYLKSGFSVISRRLNYYGDEDALVMKKELR